MRLLLIFTLILLAPLVAIADNVNLSYQILLVHSGESVVLDNYLSLQKTIEDKEKEATIYEYRYYNEFKEIISTGTVYRLWLDLDIGGQPVAKEADLVGSVPYLKTASGLGIFDNFGKELSFFPVSVYRACGNDICDGWESFGNCEIDCDSGEYDGYCDALIDGKCDVDCINPNQTIRDRDCDDIDRSKNKEDLIKFITNQKEYIKRKSLGIDSGREVIVEKSENSSATSTGRGLQGSYYSYSLFLLIPLFVLGAYLVYRKKKTEVGTET